MENWEARPVSDLIPSAPSLGFDHPAINDFCNYAADKTLHLMGKEGARLTNLVLMDRIKNVQHCYFTGDGKDGNAGIFLFDPDATCAKVREAIEKTTRRRLQYQVEHDTGFYVWRGGTWEWMTRKRLVPTREPRASKMARQSDSIESDPVDDIPDKRSDGPDASILQSDEERQREENLRAAISRLGDCERPGANPRRQEKEQAVLQMKKAILLNELEDEPMRQKDLAKKLHKSQGRISQVGSEARGDLPASLRLDIRNRRPDWHPWVNTAGKSKLHRTAPWEPPALATKPEGTCGCGRTLTLGKGIVTVNNVKICPDCYQAFSRGATRAAGPQRQGSDGS